MGQQGYLLDVLPKLKKICQELVWAAAESSDKCWLCSGCDNNLLCAPGQGGCLLKWQPRLDKMGKWISSLQNVFWFDKAEAEQDFRSWKVSPHSETLWQHHSVRLLFCSSNKGFSQAAWNDAVKNDESWRLTRISCFTSSIHPSNRLALRGKEKCFWQEFRPDLK